MLSIKIKPWEIRERNRQVPCSPSANRQKCHYTPWQMIDNIIERGFLSRLSTLSVYFSQYPKRGVFLYVQSISIQNYNSYFSSRCFANIPVASKIVLHSEDNCRWYPLAVVFKQPQQTPVSVRTNCSSSVQCSWTGLYDGKVKKRKNCKWS